MGVRVLAAKSVRLENVTIKGFTAGTTPRGVNIQTSSIVEVTMKNVTIHSDSIGIVAGGTVPGVVTMVLHMVKVEGNAIGIFVTNGNKATISNSTVSGNQTGILADTNGTNVFVYGSTVSGNGTGILSGQTGFSGSTVRLSKNVIHGNTTAVSVGAGSFAESHQDNAISGNGSPGSPLTLIGQQ